MSMSIQTNVSSLNAQRNLSTSQLALSKSMQRLSSGFRINTAADDSAGLAISENMRGQIRSMNQATRNANDGVSLIQTAEGALNETSSILVRMRELAEQSATGTVGSTERGYIQSEFNKLTSEIDRIAGSTEFNGRKLLDGTMCGDGTVTTTPGNGTMVFHIGPRNDTSIGNTNNSTAGNALDRVTLDVSAASSTAIGVNFGSTTSVQVSTQAGAQSALNSIDSAIASISSQRSNLGATQNRLQSTINNLAVAIENTSSAESRIRDVDVASETATMTRNNILTQAGTAILSQANQTPQAALSLLK